MRLPEHERRFHDVAGAVARLAAQLAQQQFRGLRRHGRNRLADRCERGPHLARERHVVEADHGEILGNRQLTRRVGA